ncbi:MAG: LEA type 2 family protein [Lautropia sp.]
MNRMLLLPRIAVLMLISCVAGCAAFTATDAPVVKVAGLEPLASEGLELRFALKMRVQNPNDAPIDFDGVAVELDLDGRGLASGVSNQAGQVPRYGEQVLTVPVSISALTALRQLLARVGSADRDLAGGAISYSLRGKLGAAGGGAGAVRFVDQGELNLFAPGAATPPRVAP